MTERHIDPLDQASANAQDLIEGLVAARRRDAAPQQVPDAEGKYKILECIEEDCGVELPIERLRLGCIRCVDCQERLEKRNKLRR